MQTDKMLCIGRVNTSLRITIPYEFAKKYGVTAGDHALWTADEDGIVRLRFVKQEAIEQLAVAS